MPILPPLLALGCLASAAPLLLGGLLPVDLAVCDQLRICGRCIYPVGDPLDHRLPGPDGERGYVATRGLQGRRGGSHSGTDLSCRGGDGLVRAMGHGVVVAATHLRNGYGYHVVLAHRLPEGELVYSVYAHLAPGSIQVAAGEGVTLGQTLGRVGASGVATSPHLHFEVRRPRVLGERWEKCRPLDALAFVAERLPTRERDSTWAGPYLAWAERGGLISPEDDPEAAMPRMRWRRTLALALCRTEGLLPGPAADLDALAEPGGDPGRPVTWKEVARDLETALSLGLCLPPGAPAAALGPDPPDPVVRDEPARRLQQISRRKSRPTTAEITLLLGDLASP